MTAATAVLIESEADQEIFEIADGNVSHCSILDSLE